MSDGGTGGERLYAATHLVNFLGCRHAIWLAAKSPEPPLPLDDDALQIVRDKGLAHEARFLETLRADHDAVAEIPSTGPLDARVALTQEAMRAGVPVIYQAALRRGRWFGYADFLRRVPRPSALGDYSYEVIDTKLARTPTAKHVMQLCVYTDLLGTAQGAAPATMHLVLGDGRAVGFRFLDFAYYYRGAVRRFDAYVDALPETSSPEPCRHCETCDWRATCAARWADDDHLVFVANIQRAQIQKLNDAGVRTLAGLAALSDDAKIPRLADATLARLRAQARLQRHKRETGENRVEVLPRADGRGFTRLPAPDPGDLFFDMEGDPHYPDGLEYLFGLYGVENGLGWFKPFWAHDHDAERRAFEDMMDFVAAHLMKHPAAHIYHYAQYEVTALKRLSTRYGTREAIVDDLLRRQKLIDLYTVVREAIRVSEPSYSIKNLEVFYMAGRADGVKTAGESIVVYERWRQTGDAALLEQIRAYNETDCRSTLLLRDWLLTLRPPDLPWRVDAMPASPDHVVARTAAEERRARYEERLLANAPDDERDLRRLVADLLEFHRRAEKPEWWAMFDRQQRTDDELVDDVECLGDLRADAAAPPVADKQSLIVTFTGPPQETKLSPGDNVLVAATLEPAGTILALDATAGRVSLRRGKRKGPLPAALSLIPPGPIKSQVLKEAVYRFAEAMIANDGRYQAVRDLLRRAPPRLDGHLPGALIIPDGRDVVAGAIEAVRRMQSTFLFLQGPPGAGKTFTASHVILALIQDGRKIGVASNSHKAINNLLRAVEARAQEAGIAFRGIKKSTAGDPDTFFEGTFVENVTDSDDVDPAADLVAGTAWLFARPALDGRFDYLFVDEAGQVALANLVAMGLSARNIVLVGDQMQLGQPIQGVHPGESGGSALAYLLRDDATIPPDRGIFLGTTWRLHDDLCRFISDAVYEGRLRPEPRNRNQALVLAAGADGRLRPTGLAFVVVAHQGCAQKSEAEAAVIQALVASLLGQRVRDGRGHERPLELDDVLVVAPYNVQVNHLKSVLPAGARVGTVDKFQGQEAEVVLVSMTTSSAEDLPRDIEFLYSRNRLNVAISRARCLAVVVASPKLLEIPCQTVDQLRLVNTLCWVPAYATDTAQR